MTDFKFNGSTLIVKINEEIDHHTCDLIKNKIDLAINFRNTKHLIFDFTGVNFMDSSGIGMVMGRYKNMHKNHGTVAVVGLKPTVKKIFTMSGLFKILSEYKNVEEAMKSEVKMA
ncbi:MAG: anti-sigma F factor antagonist [Clostridia bacterium]|nr:anti-sigma F factor antagonist [Clostridia bacterium]